MGKEIIQAIVVLILAVPFIYMFYDVTLDVIKQIHKGYSIKIKPALISIISVLVNK